ncbi:hypothetical protein Pfo_012223 [Paulownia fortunei]|nr:hypothetical protein Pfo_012223 [Paulownia fortunei]
MAAYAALVSLMHIIEQIQHHPRPPISLDQKQVESLMEKVTFLQDFLEGYSHGGSKEADGLESRIADAAYAAEDMVESQVVGKILSRSTSHWTNLSFFNFFRGLWTAIRHGEYWIEDMDFYQGMQKVIEDMDFIKKEVMEIKEKTGIQDQLHRNSMSAGSSRSPPTGQNTMVGFDDVLNEILDKLTGQQSNRQIISIVGMGGIGKTTLARNIHVKPLIVQHFDIRAWVTITQEYDMREILLEVLLCQEKESRQNLSKMNEDKLGEKLHKTLSGRKYLIVLDDMWSIKVWDKVKFFFPDNNNGSRIIITTRLSNMAFELTGSRGLHMNFLDEDESWNLLCKNVFGEESCPLELEQIGKKIAKNCKGLPLSIVVIGGLLAKSKRTRESWECIAKDLNSMVDLEDNECYSKILYTSYNQLPVHLKPCFLYMGVFSEDSEICVSDLIKLWVAERFLKPISGKSLEVVAEEYLKELIDRNLILVHKWGSNGKIKSCKIHDLLRDLCLREAEKKKFLCITRPYSLNIPQGIDIQRRIGIHLRTRPQVLDALQSSSLARCLICYFERALPLLNFRLLRVLKAVDKRPYSAYQYRYSLETIFQVINLRYIDISIGWSLISEIPSSVYLLWNLQTLVVDHYDVVIAPSEIWKMPQLRHVEFKKLDLPDPPGETMTLNLKCGEQVVKRVPNIKKLQIYYEGFVEGSACCLNNLGRLHKLESLACFFLPLMKATRSELMQNLSFPHSLKKLTLDGSLLHWEEMRTEIGSLPILEVLKLRTWSFIGPEWETVEGQFCSLKFLSISACDLECWTTDSTHFPRLEHLVLEVLDKLMEIPSGIGDIPTLQSIVLDSCSDSAVISAKKILEEQEEVGNGDLQVRVILSKENQPSQKTQILTCINHMLWDCRSKETTIHNLFSNILNFNINSQRRNVFSAMSKAGKRSIADIDITGEYFHYPLPQIAPFWVHVHVHVLFFFFFFSWLTIKHFCIFY